MSSRVNLVTLAVAVIALIVAAYAVASIPKASNTKSSNTTTVTTTVVASPPPPNVTVSLIDKVVVNVSGLHYVKLGWIYTDAPVVVELRGSGDYEIWFAVDNNFYGNPALAVLDKGNHTVAAYVNVLGPGKININYRVVG